MSTEPTAEPEQVAQQDWFLQSLVNMVNKSPIDFGITLNVAGFLVSGSLISGAEYFKGFGSDFSSSFPADSEIVESTRKIYTDFGKMVYKTGEKEADKDDLALPSFIHLKNARFFSTSGNPVPTNRGVWWRGRISEVSGFTLGTLGGPS